MQKLLPVIVLIGGVLFGCSMLTAWKAIPPPGGCDQCHQLEISANWVATYRAVQLNDETDEYPWQQPGALQKPVPSEAIEQQKVTEQRCFRCHKSPDKAHKERQGRYHH